MAIEQTVERIKQLPRRADEVWQGALVRMPVWVGEEKPQRPLMAIWVDLKSGRINATAPMMPDEAGPDLLLEAMVSPMMPGTGIGHHRPGKLWVSDPELAQYLRGRLAGTETEVEEVENDAPVQQVVDFLTQGMMGSAGPAGLLSGQDVTLERARAFAEAAAEFYRAAPWQQLVDEDLIQIEAPAAPNQELSHVTVLGAGGQAFGLGFFKSRRDHEAMYGLADPQEFAGKKGTKWAVFFNPLPEIPMADVDLFEDRGFPVAGDGAYPVPAGFGRKPEDIQRPDARQLAFLEGLLRALAQTTEAEIDAGRWTKRVATADGEVEYVLALPDLLEAMTGKKQEPVGGMPDRRVMERMMRDAMRRVQEKGLETPEEINQFLNETMVGKVPEPLPPASPEEEAQNLVYDAADARGRRKVQLARKALEIWPDCADAYALLAERTGDPAKAAELYRQAMAAGERALGPELFKEAEGEFWGLIETRPYMRARQGLADCLVSLGRIEEAVEHYIAMLRLNPGDNQGVRYSLAPLLYELGRYDELQALLSQFSEYGLDPTLQYLQALLTFRREGDSPKARQEIAKALKQNKHFKKYLLGDAELSPWQPPTYTPGGEDEAIIYADYLAPLWQKTEGAVAWLKQQKLPGARKQTKPKRKKK